jgi:hypothetical protein
MAGLATSASLKTINKVALVRGPHKPTFRALILLQTGLTKSTVSLRSRN